MDSVKRQLNLLSISFPIAEHHALFHLLIKESSLVLYYIARLLPASIFFSFTVDARVPWNWLVFFLMFNGKKSWLVGELVSKSRTILSIFRFAHHFSNSQYKCFLMIVKTLLSYFFCFGMQKEKNHHQTNKDIINVQSDDNLLCKSKNEELGIGGVKLKQSSEQRFSSSVCVCFFFETVGIFVKIANE